MQIQVPVVHNINIEKSIAVISTIATPIKQTNKQTKKPWSSAALGQVLSH